MPERRRAQMLEPLTEFALVEEVVRGVRVVAVGGEVDIGSKEALATVLAPAGDPLLVDLSDVTFMDSSGLAALVAARQVLDGGRQAFALVCPSDGAAARLFELTGVDEMFTVFRSPKAAMEWLVPR